MEGKKHADYSVTLAIPFLHSTQDCVVINSKEEKCTNISGASFLSTCFNGLNALLGVGLLSIPYALAGGWLSLILLLVIASLTFYTGLLIQRCMDTDPTIRSYPDIGNRAFGKTGEAIVSITMNPELYLVATGFLILEGDNLSNLFPDMDFGYHIGAKSGFIVLVALIILPTIWGRVVNWSGIPSAISLYAFCYCAHPVFPTLYTSMRNQRQFSKVLFLCFAFSTVTYSLMAVIGYLMYGSNVESQITLNLPTNNISSRVAICTTIITPIAKYALMLTPIVDSIEAQFHASYNKFIRTILMISTVIVALSLPFFGYLMSLVGALLSATTSIIIPCLCYLKISGIYRRIGVEVVFVGFVLLSGLIVAVVGTYVSLVDIVSQL
ncbi:putative amino acid transporter, transmembrane domain-containing protein [Helianthus debilis subsp. tardiflorus]